MSKSMLLLIPMALLLGFAVWYLYMRKKLVKDKEFDAKLEAELKKGLYTHADLDENGECKACKALRDE